MIRIILILSLFASGCANTNPLRVPDEHAATLQSRAIEKNGRSLSLMFEALDGEILDPGWMTAPVNASYRAPQGQRNLVVRVVHRPPFKPFGRPYVLEAKAAMAARLVAGRTYVPEVEIDAGLAKIWVKDAESDQPVSEQVTKHLVTVEIRGSTPIIVPVK